MKIEVAKSAGFCFGVERAVKLLNETIDTYEKDIYTIGPIIHNPQIIHQMETKGVQIVDDPKQLPKDSIAVIRAHGLPKSDYQLLNDRAKVVVDTTCTKTVFIGDFFKVHIVVMLVTVDVKFNTILSNNIKHLVTYYVVFFNLRSRRNFYLSHNYCSLPF